jgi:hypothetical protein
MNEYLGPLKVNSLHASILNAFNRFFTPKKKCL